MARKWFGWKGRILRVDLTRRKIFMEDLDRGLVRNYIGCRGVNAKIVYDEVSAGADPLGPENVLIFGTGPLEGTPIGLGRVSIATKSPRGTLAEGGFGGFFGPELKFAGYDFIVITGRAEKPVYIVIEDAHAEIRDASDLWGKTTWETDKVVKEEVGDPDAQVAYIGPAAENLVYTSPVFSNLNHSGCRTGCGTIMGSKKLKAIAVRGSGGVQIAEPEKFEEAYESMREILDLRGMDHYLPVYGIFGASSQIRIFNEIGFLHTRNVQDLRFEGADKVSGEVYLDKYVKKGKACFCCFNPACIKWYEVHDGPYAGTKGGGLQASDLLVFTSLMGIDYLPAALKARTLCNQLGLDVMHVGYSIAWAMECYENGILTKKDTDGLELKFGNHKAMIEMIEKIALRQGFGNVLAEGVEKASKIVGKGSDRYKLTIKGLELEGMPQRTFYIGALGLAVSPTGPDHTRWYPPYPANPAIATRDLLRELDLNIDLKKAFETKSPEGKGKLLKFLEDSRAVLESLPSCVYAPRGILGIDFRKWTSMLVAGTGIDFTYKEVMTIGERICNVERAFIVREGFRRRHDTIPRRMLEEPVPSAYCGPLTPSSLDQMLDEYYEARGWDKKTSIPTRSKLEALGLDGIANDRQ